MLALKQEPLPLFGPTLRISQQLHEDKYRQKGETFYEAMHRVATALCDSVPHKQELETILLEQRFLPAGRIQTGAGADKNVTLFNCFVSGTIEDTFTEQDGIMQRATEAAETMRRGGGVGYNFGSIRPAGTPIKTLGSVASGPISFMHIFDAVCKTVSSAGHRRGAQMGILPVSHPDIFEFVKAKQNDHSLTAFNISVGITDDFMFALKHGTPYNLEWEGQVVKTIDPKELWEEIMKSTWDYAEPGVIFLDRINKMNNLWYCEDIQATNPCSEQPLPPFGACLLGSFNLVKYIKVDQDTHSHCFDWAKFKRDIPCVVRAMDNVVDISMYPLPEQETEAKHKRRLGLGITGFANASEILGRPYGSEECKQFLHSVLKMLRDECYRASVNLAKEKGPFPLFDADYYLDGDFINSLPEGLREEIRQHGIRNSHLISIAPTGTISICADNVSSGIEPVFSYGYERKINTPNGQITEFFSDYAYREYGIKGKTAEQLTAQEHLDILLISQEYVDSAVSKTCNVSPNMPWEDFKELYLKAWEGGAKGLSTFNVGGKRMGILTTSTVEEKKEEGEALACYFDPATGTKSCG
jgi:ribonucleoside-diphosphate reductase alpha chain